MDQAPVTGQHPPPTPHTHHPHVPATPLPPPKTHTAPPDPAAPPPPLTFCRSARDTSMTRPFRPSEAIYTTHTHTQHTAQQTAAGATGQHGGMRCCDAVDKAADCIPAGNGCPDVVDAPHNHAMWPFFTICWMLLPHDHQLTQLPW